MIKVVTDDQIRSALKTTFGNRAAAGRLLGVSERTVQRRAKSMDDLPISPFSVYPIMPEGHKLKGVSSLQRVTDPETGETVLQWVKTAADIEKRELLCREALDAMTSKIARVSPVIKSRTKLPADLASLYILTDYHIGMMAWGEETGESWDLKIAEKLLLDWFHYAIKHSPKASHAVLAQLGDFLHYDSLESVTPAHRNILDSDTRPQKMVRVGIRVLRQVIDWLLKKHDTLHVIMAEGNHDPMASAWLRETFAALYEKEKRIVVETRPDPYYVYTWGSVVLFFHHGHIRKPESIDDVFVQKFREEYGASRFAYGHMGHLHCKKALETTLMEIEQHPTLAARDAYASRGGWSNNRRASVITYHRDFGEVGRMGITPEMVKE